MVCGVTSLAVMLLDVLSGFDELKLCTAYRMPADLAVRAFVEGQQSWRVAATAKHFPGHGATDEDSHVTAPTIGTSLDLLDRRELVPFRAAISAGVQIVMTAHITVPALDPLQPATLSRIVITDLLRERLGFGGVVMTDALDMHAVSRTVGVEEGAVLALGAGVDALCLGGV